MLSDFGRGVGTGSTLVQQLTKGKPMIELNDAIVDYEKAHDVRIDYARPQSWFDAVLNAKVNIDPRDYVWVYTKANMTGGLFGQPVHKDTIMVDVIKRQNERTNVRLKQLGSISY